MPSVQSPDAGHHDFVLSRRITDYARTVPAEALTGLILAIVAFWSLHEPQQAGWFIGWLVIMIALQAFRAVHPSLTKPLLVDREGKRRFWRLAMAIAIVNSLGWAVGFALFGYYANPSQFALICVLVGGMGAGAVLAFRAAPVAALVDVLSVTMGGLAAVAAAPTDHKLAIGLIMICGAIFLLYSVHEQEAEYLARLRQEADLRKSNQTIGLLLNEYETNASDWLWSTDDSGALNDVSERFGEVAKRSPSVLEGMNFCDLFDDGRECELLRNYLRSTVPFRDLVLPIAVAGQSRYWSLSAQPSEQGGLRGFASDVTQSKKAEDRATYLTHFDGLTELPNRLLFEETLVAAVRNHGSLGLAVLHIDLDDFKTTNETLGHASGDLLLRAAAQRLESLVRGVNFLARIAGDEFAVLLRDVHHQDVACKFAEDVLAAVRDPFVIDDQTVVSTVSVGIAFDDRERTSAADLQRQADLALHAAKAEGRGRLAVFAPALDVEARRRRGIELDLREEISRGGFELQYQPLLDVQSGIIAGREALLRWEHPDRGAVSPDEFITIAENTGLIVPLGEWVLWNALEDAADWPDTIRVAINLSPAQMRNTQLVSGVAAALADSGIDPTRVEFEITENVLMHDSETNLATLHKLKSLGIRIALDDFGTGFSSLNYLRAFPFDKIKIDRCFVEDLETSPGNQAILRSTVHLAQALGMETTAEGVEREAQFNWLRDIGCDQAQGFFISGPLRKEELGKGHWDRSRRTLETGGNCDEDAALDNVAHLFAGRMRKAG